MRTAKRLDNITEYYFSSKLREIDDMKERGVDVINLGIGNPDMPPAKEVTQVLINESLKPENNGYQGYKGIDQLRLAFARWYKKYFKVSRRALLRNIYRGNF